VGESVDEKDCKAGFEDGILTIEVPKQPEHQEPAKRMITIA
jgi:HSP20 family molecular chaperone IbpA